MPKFLAGSHYSEEAISQHLEKNRGYWPVQIDGNKSATGENLKKPVEEVVKGRILAGWAPKSPEPWCGLHPSANKMLILGKAHPPTSYKWEMLSYESKLS